VKPVGVWPLLPLLAEQLRRTPPALPQRCADARLPSQRAACVRFARARARRQHAARVLRQLACNHTELSRVFGLAWASEEAAKLGAHRRRTRAERAAVAPGASQLVDPALIAQSAHLKAL
jgi:hypothetical protein